MIYALNIVFTRAGKEGVCDLNIGRFDNMEACIKHRDLCSKQPPKLLIEVAGALIEHLQILPQSNYVIKVEE